MSKHGAVNALRTWLKEEPRAKRTVLMPMKSEGKMPLMRHAGKAKWEWEEADAFVAANPGHTAWGLLLDGLCVVDCDEAAA